MLFFFLPICLLAVAFLSISCAEALSYVKRTTQCQLFFIFYLISFVTSSNVVYFVLGPSVQISSFQVVAWFMLLENKIKIEVDFQFSELLTGKLDPVKSS